MRRLRADSTYETYSYYKKSFRANAWYYKKTGKDVSLFGGVDINKSMLSEKAWQKVKQTSNLSNKDIVWNQFHKYNKSTTQAIVESVRASGGKVTPIDIFNISQGKLPEDTIKAVEARHKELLKEGHTSTEIAKIIGQEFYGSN